MRTILILIATLMGLAAFMALIIGVGMSRLRAANREADRQWVSRNQAATQRATSDSPAAPPSTAPNLPADASATSAPAPLADPTVALAEPRLPTAIILYAVDAKVHGVGMWQSSGDIENWTAKDSVVEWPITLTAAGFYTVEMFYALNNAGREFALRVGDKTIGGRTEPTTAWSNYRTANLGELSLPAGDTKLSVTCAKAGPGVLMHLHWVRLTPRGMAPAPDLSALPTVLAPADAMLHGEHLKSVNDPDARIINWTSTQDWMEWQPMIRKADYYRVYLTLSNADTTGGDFTLTTDEQTLRCRAGSTGGFDTPRMVYLGTVHMNAGRKNIAVKPGDAFRYALMNLWKVELIRQ